MPIPPPTPTVPYDTAEMAMVYARVRLNDCPLGLVGNLLADSQPYSQTFCNLGWRRFQSDLAQAGDPAQTEEVLITGIPVVAGIDPATLVWIDQTGFWDGSSFWPPSTVSPLPQNLIQPLHLKERLAGTVQKLGAMDPCDNGLPMGPKTTYLRFWEWRGSRIYMPGATVMRDLWVRYASFLPDINTVGTVQWYNQPLPILRCADVLSYYIAAEFSYSRGSEQAKKVANSFWADGKEAMRGLMNQTTMKVRQRINHRRRPYPAFRHNGWNTW